MIFSQGITRENFILKAEELKYIFADLFLVLVAATGNESLPTYKPSRAG